MVRDSARGAGGGEAPDALRPSSAAPLVAELRTAIEAMPVEIREVVTRGGRRLVEYQDVGYARRYLELLRPFVPAVTGGADEMELGRVVARYLALWMSYEDAVRVADLKTRAGRFARIRGSARDKDAVVVVTDYLKPDLDEIWGVLPDRLVRPFARWAERRWPHGRPTLGQHVRTTTVSGYLRVWLLARLKPWRPISYRAREEHARIGRWLAAVRACAAHDTRLAVEAARAGQLVKGYGDVRRRLLAVHEQLVAAVLRSVEVEAAAGKGFTGSTALAARLRALALEGPDGEAQIPAVVAEALGARSLSPG
jgi:indolepyruvate ferredoxin oxidoreductase beta subunit